jgi:hypothetical protein
MGGLIPTPMDQEIVFKLNTTFSGAAFQSLTSHLDGPASAPTSLFDPSKRLSRIARRIGAYPQSMDNTDPNNPARPGRRNPRARWYHFLEMLENQYDNSAGTGPTTADAIKSALQTAISAGNIVGVVFDVTYTPAAPKLIFLEPNNSNPGHIFQVGNTSNYVMFLTLICQDHIPNAAINHHNNKGPNELPVNGMVWPIDDQDQYQP